MRLSTSGEGSAETRHGLPSVSHHGGPLRCQGSIITDGTSLPQFTCPNLGFQKIRRYGQDCSIPRQGFCPKSLSALLQQSAVFLDTTETSGRPVSPPASDLNNQRCCFLTPRLHCQSALRTS